MSDLKVGRIEQLTHTPGPWFVERMYEGSRTVAILRDFKGPNVALAVHGPQNWIHAAGAEDQIEANARLIAAAPDLLAALRLVATLDLATDILAGNEDVLTDVLAAIAKAEGRS